MAVSVTGAGSPAERSERLIEPFRATPNGRYDDGYVVVERAPTPGFTLAVEGATATLRHGLAEDAIDNDLAGLLAAAGVEDNELFERLFTGIVLSMHPDPVLAWARFFENTLARLTGPDPGNGSISELAPVYRMARSLVVGNMVLDVASCFGFLPVLLAADGHDVVACDLNVGSMRLLSAVDGHRGGRLRTFAGLAQQLPLASSTVDTVFALHLLEHMPDAEGRLVLAEAMRVARRRVVFAVPYEDVPTRAYGHVRTLDHAALAALGECGGSAYRVLDQDGGWLVVDL